MNTIKILGGGPLVGKTFYATNQGPLYDNSQAVILQMDEPPFRVRTLFAFDVTTGYLSALLAMDRAGGGQTDLLKVDPSELAKLWF